MKRVVGSGIFALAIATATVSGQTRDTYQQAYRDWQKNDPSLERDAAKAGDAATPRTEKAAADAGKFVSARKAFYDAQRTDLAEKLKALERLEPPVEPEGARTAEIYASTQEVTVTGSIEAFGGDPDRGIQQLRQALEKERAALATLRSAIKNREAATDAARQANDGAERARNGAADQIRAISASFEQSSQESGQLAEAWTAYYHAVANGARGLVIPDTTPAPGIRPLIPAPSVTPQSTASPRPASGGVPISRYTGSWNFLPGVSTYHGVPPISFDLIVREEGGQFFGTLNARFIVAGKTDPVVRFDFSGPIQTARFQTFPLQTAEGGKGTIELIPGNAFNLLEVNYTLEGAPGKVRESDVILVKR